MVAVPGAGLAEVGAADVEVPLGALVVDVVAAGAAPLFGTLFGHHVEDHAAGGDRGVAAAGRHLHLLEGVEIVIGRRGAGGGHVGDHHAVDRPDGLIAAGAGAHVLRLLAALVAADVDAVGEHAGGRRQHRPGVAHRGGLLQVGQGHGGIPARLARVEQRRSVADDGDLFRDLEREVDLGRAADVDLDVLVLGGSEALELALDRIETRREAQEVELPLGVGRLGLRSPATDEGDGHSGHRLAVGADRLAIDIAALQLGQRRRGEDQQQGGDVKRALRKQMPNHEIKPP